MSERETMEGMTSESILDMRNGRLILETRGKMFPKGGGAECGGWQRSYDLTDHLEQLIREAMKPATVFKSE